MCKNFPPVLQVRHLIQDLLQLRLHLNTESQRFQLEETENIKRVCVWYITEGRNRSNVSSQVVQSAANRLNMQLKLRDSDLIRPDQTVSCTQRGVAVGLQDIKPSSQRWISI